MAFIGIIGGSFNPAHKGHIEISKNAKKQIDLDEVWWVLAPYNPHKNPTDLVDSTKRYEYAKNISKPDFIKVKILEDTKKPSFSINLILTLLKNHPEHKFIWLMGADNAVSFDKWFQYKKIINLINIAIFPRNDNLELPNVFSENYNDYYIISNEITKLKNAKPPAWSIIRMNKINISATEIRNGTNK